MSATRSLSSSSRKRGARPAFYQPPSSSTSAQIIAEARQSLRVLPTDRPFTPADANRILFGNRKTHSRPPSVYSIGARHFTESHPSTAQKLMPIESHLKPTPPTPVQSTCLLPQSRSNTKLEWHEDSNEEPLPHPHPHHTLSGHTPSQMSVRRQSASGTDLVSSHSTTHLDPKPSQRSPHFSRRVASAELVPKARSIATERLRLGEGGEGGGGGRRRERREGGRQEQRRSSEPPGPSVGAKAHPATQQGEQGRPGRKKKTEAPQFWQVEVSPLLSELSAPSLMDEETLRQTVDRLWERLRERECLGREGGRAGVKQRSAVLRTVFSLLDSSDPSLLARLARVILAMQVTGKNLLNVCKLLFSLARTESNDQFFIEEAIVAPLVDLLSTCEPVSDSEALVYGVGTLKLLASNTELRAQLSSGGALPLFCSILNHYCKTAAEPSQLTSIQNVLVQLTAALRNLCEEPSLRPALLSSSLLPLLAATLSNHLSHPDIAFNISRLLSKLTLHGECRTAVLDCPAFLPLLLHSLTIHNSHPDILVRVCFILGNLTAEDQQARSLLFSTHHTLPTLTSLTGACLAAELGQVKEKNSQKSSNEDLLIKLVRLLANLSVHPDVGRAVASDKTSVDHLMSILTSLPLTSYRELTANSLAALNNLSYHASSDSYLVQHQQHLAQLLVRVLLEDDREALLECVRVYGNLSRYPSVRQTLTEKKVDELLMTLLDSSHSELVYASCGVLMNLMADECHRAVLASSGGVGKLLDVLRDFACSDWQLAGLVCKTLWNFSENMTSAVSCFGEEETQQLLHLLHSYCDLPSDGGQTAAHDGWQDHFLPVGRGLLERVLAHHTHLVALDDSHR